MILKCIFPLLLIFQLLHLSLQVSTETSARDALYSNARQVRTLQGHEAALPLYQRILNDHIDYSAASHLGASPLTPSRQDLACRCDRLEKIQTLRETILRDYTHGNIKQMMRIPPEICCQGPVYLTPVAAGSCGRPPEIESKLDCLVTLFLLGICVDVDTVKRFIGGDDAMELLQDLGLAFIYENGNKMVVPHVHLFPIDFANSNNRNNLTLILATDLHPRVLSTTTVGNQNNGAVMYIGPDSLSLVRHIPKFKVDNETKILDLCTGSGVQALAALARSSAGITATCVDINPRALQFTRFNAALNGFGVLTIQGDLMVGIDDDLVHDSYDLILANPPFIPVPPAKEILQRYGLFSSGGADGEVILRRVLELAGRKLAKEHGVLSIVSEFMNPQDPTLLERLMDWWGITTAATGVLLTNEVPVNDAEYAARRADSEREYNVWLEHLHDVNINHVSPGLLFVQSSSEGAKLELKHHIVPKTKHGSIWTPSNRDAMAFIDDILSKLSRV